MATIYVERLRSLTTSAVYLVRLNRPPRYFPPHRARGLSHKGEAEWDEPESVRGQGGHRPFKGRVDIRPVPEAYAADLEKIDAERAALKKRLTELAKEERDVLALAWQASKNLTVAEVKAAAEAEAVATGGQP